MLSLTAESCELFNIPFYQFAQMKKFCPEDIPAIKADYKLHWDNWKAIIQEVAKQLGTPFAKPHIESWTNGWQVRAHFFAYDQFDFKQFADFDIWREDESEYDDFRQVKDISEKDLLLRSDEDFWCIGKSIEKAELHQIDPVSFITQTIQQLQPLYDRCHQ